MTRSVKILNDYYNYLTKKIINYLLGFAGVLNANLLEVVL